MKYLACLDDVQTQEQCSVQSTVWVAQQSVVLDKEYFPDLSPSEVYMLAGAIILQFAVAYAWKSVGRSIRD